MKVTVVGAGNVGATVANVLATKNICSEVVLIDIKEGVSEGKAMDIMQTAHVLNFDTVVTGVTNDYAATANSEVVVVTSGIPRKPGMSREDLIGTNAKIEQLQVNTITMADASQPTVNGSGLYANSNAGLICACKVVGDVKMEASPPGERLILIMTIIPMSVSLPTIPN